MCSKIVCVHKSSNVMAITDENIPQKKEQFSKNTQNWLKLYISAYSVFNIGHYRIDGFNFEKKNLVTLWWTNIAMENHHF